MKYDPIKKQLGKFFNISPLFRILFYRSLDLLLLRTWHVKRALKAWKKDHPKQASILDAGSGFGQYTYYLTRLSPGYQITAVDVMTDQIQECNAFFNKIAKGERVEFQEADLTQYEKKESFDLILSVDVMEHIEDDRQVFKNFYHSLKTGGMLLISTPSDKGGSDVHEEDDHSFIEEHVRDGYGIDEITEKLKAAGLSEVKAGYSYGNPGKISWKLSMKYPIIMLNTSKIFYVLLPFYYLISLPFCFLLNYFDIRMNHKEGTGLIVKAYK